LIAQQRYEPAGFRVSLLLKDLRLALAAADTVGAPMPMANVVHDALLEAASHGDGDHDVATLARVAMRRSGSEDVPRRQTA
jgi:3-hydroxyisobutyrate dehydrogenase-like beta-hydroxyacid dehydrogenase